MNTRLEDAMALHQAGRLEDAQQSYRVIVEDDPGNADALHLLGVTHFQQGDFAEAIRLIWSSIELNPTNPLAYGNLGNAFQARSSYKEAINCYDSSLGLDPLNADTHFNRGMAMQRSRRLTDALGSYDAAIGIRADFAEAYFQRGNALHLLHRNQEAISSYDQAVVFDGMHAEAFFNRGVSQQLLAEHEAALKSYTRAIRIKPDYVEALNNQGNTLQNLELYQRALESYAQAQSIDPDYGDAHWNEALCRLKTGDFEAGWKKYEWRWENTISNPHQRSFTQPLWTGQEELHGKTILLHAEQGLGDTIQFCRYAEMVAERGATVTLEVPASLNKLLKTVAGVSNIVDTSDESVYDYHCPLLSLPLAFDTRLSSIPSSTAYIESDASINQRWQQILGEKTSLRIGLVLSGNPENTIDQLRSVPVAEIAQILRQDVEWFCLQKVISVENLDFMRAHGIQQFSAELKDFSETAALIEHMDMVISVDTAVAHLAAALGKPTWILLPHCGDFRWLLGRRDTPWYPSVRLFRQINPGDWGGVLAGLKSKFDSCISDFDEFGVFLD